MVISGEGSDEIFGGYLYFHKAPNKDEFHRETCHKVRFFFFLSFDLIFSYALQFANQNTFCFFFLTRCNRVQRYFLN